MVTVNRIGGQEINKGAELYGLSSDVKPINDELPNGSIFIELDTQIGYMWDAENKRWVTP